MSKSLKDVSGAFETLGAVAAVVFALIVLTLVGLLFYWTPIFTIWSLNLLFGLSIPLTLKTWFAMFWLDFVLTNPISIYRNNRLLEKISKK